MSASFNSKLGGGSCGGGLTIAKGALSGCGWAYQKKFDVDGGSCDSRVWGTVA